MTNWPRSRVPQPITDADVWPDLFNLEDLARRRAAEWSLVSRGVSALDLLRARRWHRIGDARCPCPDHANTGFHVTWHGAERDRMAALWRQRVGGFSP
jgi:hypothetical protein